MTAAGKTALFWLVLIVTAGFIAGLGVGLNGPRSAAVDTWINLLGGVAVSAGGAYILWRSRAPGSPPEPMRGPLRMLAAGQTLLGLSFVIPDIRVRAIVLAIVVLPMFVAGVRLRRAIRMMKKA